MAASLLPWIKPQFTDAEGVPTASGKLYSFVAGTDTPQATYSDSDLAIANANPILLNAGGWSLTSIYLLPTGYKFRLDTADDVPLWTVDDVLGAGAGADDGGTVTGDWQDIAFDAANFTCAGSPASTITVSAPMLNRWRQIGPTAIVWVFTGDWALSGANSAAFHILNLPFDLTQTSAVNLGLFTNTVPSGDFDLGLRVRPSTLAANAVDIVREDSFSFITGYAGSYQWTVLFEVTPPA